MLSTSLLAAALPKFTLVTEQFPPYNYLNQAQQLDGVVTRIVQTALGHMQQSLPIELKPWQQALEQAKTAPDTLIYSILRTPEREPHFIWLATGISIEMNFYGNCEREINNMADLAQISHQRIGLLKAGSYDEFIHQHIDISKNQLIYGKNYTELFNQLQRQELDILVAPKLLMLYLWHQMPEAKIVPKLFDIPQTYQNQLYIALNKNTDSRWVQLWQKTLRKMKQTGEIQAIYQQFEQEHAVLTSVSPF